MIDFHVHPLFVEELGHGPDQWKKVKAVFLTENSELPVRTRPLQELLAKMNSAEVETSVLLPIDCQRARGISVLSNADVHLLCSLSNRLIGFASVDPMSPSCMDKLEEARALGLRGLKLDPALQGFAIADTVGHPVWETVSRLHWPVVIHVGYSFVPQSRMYASTVQDLEVLAYSYPGINFVAAHWAFPWTMEACLLAIKHPNVYIDTSAFYFDNPRRFANYMVERVAPTSLIDKSLREKIVFGSNYPRVYIKDMKDALGQLPLSDKTICMIMGANASRLLNDAAGC